MKKKLYLFYITFTLIISSYSYGQQNFWSTNSLSPRNSKNFQNQLVKRIHTPAKSIKLNLEYGRLVEYLKGSSNSSKILKFPDDKGVYNNYKITETSNLSKNLQAKYPNIKSYAGYNIENPNQRINFSLSPEFGLHGSINEGQKNILIDAYSKDKSRYIIYDKKYLINNSKNKFKCSIEENESGLGINNLDFKSTKILSSKSNNGNLRKFRLAITTTREYSEYILEQAGLESGTKEQKKAAILAAVNVSLTRINGILKNDLGIFLELIPNTDSLFFIYDNYSEDDDDGDDDDEYSKYGIEKYDTYFDITDTEKMIEQNIFVTNKIIGVSNYDIGHLFFKTNVYENSNGAAYTPSICIDENKAGAVTGTVYPVGDAFDIDFTAHEIGHQLGASHTHDNDCNRAYFSSVEPGSGSTIMSYTGVCEPNVQANSDAYYHTISIEQIYKNLNNVSCGTSVATSNIAPVIKNDLASSYTIPHSTAFALETIATDANNDQLTYAWVQMDTLKSNRTPPVSSNTQGPNFRSFPPTTQGIRYFPKLEKILNNQLIFDTNKYYPQSSDYNENNWEVIPNNPRTMNFAVTVRDNNNDVGMTARKDLKVNFSNVGPFKVTSQTANEKWHKNSIKKITWDVAGTNSNGIDTKNVKILLSTNGGKSFDYTLVESIPNNGAYTFYVPSNVDNTNEARIMIKAINNIFLAVNSSNFTIDSDKNQNSENSYYINLSPVPSSGIIYLTYSEDFTEGSLTIVDIIGRIVYSKKLENQKNHTINLSNLSNGIYIATIEFDGQKTTKKIIIKK